MDAHPKNLESAPAAQYSVKSTPAQEGGPSGKAVEKGLATVTRCYNDFASASVSSCPCRTTSFLPPRFRHRFPATAFLPAAPRLSADRLTTRLRALIPTREALLGNRWLAWLRPFLDHPQLWRWSRRGVATGVALGIFFGLLIPIAQIPLSAAAAVLLRANVPAAAASTLITNPVTFGPVYYLAYQLGNRLTGRHATPPPPASDNEHHGDTRPLGERLQHIGLPLLVGLAVMATACGLGSYALISLVWYLRVKAKRRRRLSKPG